MFSWQTFAEKAIRTPFKEKGRSYEGIDCWGLIYLGYRDVLGKEIPNYVNCYKNISDYKVIVKIFNMEKIKYWIEVDRQIGAVASIIRRGAPIHCGIAITKREILHCDYGVGTVIESDSQINIDSFWVLRDE